MGVSRGFKAVVGGTLACAVLAGCTTADSERSAPEPSPSPVTTPAQPVTLDLGVYGPKDSVTAYEHLAEAFSDENPHVTVEVSRHDDAEALMDSVVDGAAPDVFLIDHDHLPQLVDDELVQPVDKLLEERQVDFGDGYQRGGLTAFAADAALQCMPHDVSPLVVYYNQDLVDLERLGTEEEEPPNALDGWSWEMFGAAARQAARGRVDGVYLEPSLTALAPFIWSAGGEIVDDPQDPARLTLSEGDTREALEQVLTLARDPELTPTAQELARQDALTRFKRGRLGMILGTRELTPELRAVEGLHFDVMPLPSLGRFRTVADMSGYCISADSDQVDVAGDFLAFAISREGASITARPGYVVPANLEVANSAAFAQRSRQPESSFIFNEGVRRAQSLPFVASWPELSERVGPHLERMFNAPVIDLDTLLTEIDTLSAEVLAPEEE